MDPDRPAPEETAVSEGRLERAAAGRLADVARRLPAGETRPQQLAMTRAVARAIETDRHLVVQAGTGTGKSLAYLVPAVLSGRKVVVATATKALQDQLGQKDLPLLADTVGEPFTFAVLKGRSNYLCRQRAAEVGQRGVQPRLATDVVEAADAGTAVQASLIAGMPDEPSSRPSAPPRSAGTPAAGRPAPGRLDDEVDPGDGRLVSQVRRLLEWAESSPTGDRADLPFEPSDRAWSMVSVGPRECPGAFRCPSGDDCFAESARAAAAEADVVVVNTHLYGSHLASGGMVLPEHDVAVFDEAHELEEVMTQSLGVDLSPGRFRALAVMARPFADRDEGSALDELAEIGDRLAAELAPRTGARVLDDGAGPEQTEAPEGPEPDGRERARWAPRPGPTPDPGADRRLADLLALAAARLERVSALLRGADDEAEIGRRARAQSAAGHLAEDLAHLAGRGDDDVAWVDGTDRAPVLRLSPIDVGPPLAAALWPQVTAVLTSATVPLRLPDRLGLTGFDVDQLDVGSPFDYRGHSLLYVARHLPDPRRPEAEAAIHGELEALIRAAGGRTLALFTSRRATEAAATALADRLDYRLLVQGALPKGRLLEAFAEEETSCLFATLGFWQGVDVPGRALMLVTLDKLPFARPDDPLLQARRDRAGEAAFRLVDIPRAATLLAQGAGRLIRSATDRGVVAVLDPRLATAGYRGVLLAAMPPMRRTADRRQVEDFLARAIGATDASTADASTPDASADQSADPSADQSASRARPSRSTGRPPGRTGR
jgi:ATP-dependent DNA helicase DinG